MAFRRKLLVLDKAHALLIDVNKTVPGIRRSHHQTLKRRLLKSALSTSSDIAEGRTKKVSASSSDSSTSRWDQQASFNTS
ncbi:MAG TPA: four helix bundle protein [Gemmatimonadaceae bacterium]|nr:four helix bundle protein [Gemmatimonadaceae bacterium]